MLGLFPNEMYKHIYTDSSYPPHCTFRSINKPPVNPYLIDDLTRYDQCYHQKIWPQIVNGLKCPSFSNAMSTIIFSSPSEISYKSAMEGSFTQTCFQTDASKPRCDWLTISQSFPHWLRAPSGQNEFEDPKVSYGVGG